MKIDWFTIAAQILNFLVLVYLLRRFLYPAIIGAMDRREHLIASRIEDAEEKTRKAEEAETSYMQQKQALAASSEQLMAEAREAAEKLRLRLTEQAHTEVDADKAEWVQAIQSQRDEFYRLLRLRAAEQVMAISRRALQDLADEQLEQRIVLKFLERLKNGGKEEFAAIREGMKKDGTAVTISSSFALPEEMQRAICDALKAHLGRKVEPVYTTSSDLVGGIELSVGETRIAWTVQSYLDELEEEVLKEIGGAR